MVNALQEGATPACPYCDRPVEVPADPCPHCAGATGSRERFATLILSVPLVMMLMIWSAVAIDQFKFPSLDFIPAREITFFIKAQGVLWAAPLLALLVGLDAWRHGRAGVEPSRLAPVLWSAATLLLWPVLTPIYLFRRRRCGLKNRLLPGLLLVIGLGVSIWGADAVIYDDPYPVRAAIASETLSAAQADGLAESTLVKARRAIEDAFFEQRQYPQTAEDFFSGFGDWQRPGLTLIYVSGGRDFYQLIAWHAQGETDYLVRTADSEVYEFPRSDVLADLDSRYGRQAITRQGQLIYVAN